MKLIESWLDAAKQLQNELKEYSSNLDPLTAEAQAVALQIVELKEIMKETERNGFFSDRASRSHLITISTRENLKLNEKVIEDVGYLYDISSRALRLGPEKAERVLKMKGANQT